MDSWGAPGRRRRSRAGEDGAAAVEFALLVPVICVVVFATISYAYMFSFRQALSQAAAEGARASVGAAVTGTCPPTAAAYPVTGCPAQAAAADAVARSLDGYGMTCNGAAHLTCAITPPTTCSGPPAASGQCVTVTVSYPYREHDLLPSVPGFGFTLPETLRFSSTVVVR